MNSPFHFPSFFPSANFILFYFRSSPVFHGFFFFFLFHLNMKRKRLKKPRTKIMGMWWKLCACVCCIVSVCVARNRFHRMCACMSPFAATKKEFRSLAIWVYVFCINGWCFVNHIFGSQHISIAPFYFMLFSISFFWRPFYWIWSTSSSSSSFRHSFEQNFYKIGCFQILSSIHGSLKLKIIKFMRRNNGLPFTKMEKKINVSFKLQRDSVS